MRRLYFLMASGVGCAVMAIPAGAAPTAGAAPAPGQLAPDLVFTYTVGVAVGTDANNRDMVVARRDGSETTPVITGDTDDHEPSWSPNGDRIAFVRRAACSGSGTECSGLPNDLWVANEDGSAARAVTQFRLARATTWAYSLSWSPDGSRIAHCRSTPRASSLWISRVDRRASTRLSSARCGDVAWAPDGRRLAVALGTGIVLMTPAGRVDRVLHRGGTGLVWSPDSTRVAFRTGDGLYSITADGTARKRKLLGRGFEALSWSRAEMILAGNRGIYRRSAATGRLETLISRSMSVGLGGRRRPRLAAVTCPVPPNGTSRGGSSAARAGLPCAVGSCRR